MKEKIDKIISAYYRGVKSYDEMVKNINEVLENNRPKPTMYLLYADEHDGNGFYLYYPDPLYKSEAQDMIRDHHEAAMADYTEFGIDTEFSFEMVAVN